MATITQAQATKAALTVTGFSTLASATYVESAAYNCNTNKPMDVVVEVEAATTNTPGGNKQILVFVKASLDGTNFQTGPSSGTSNTDEADMTYLGRVPVNSATNTHRKTFSIAQALGYVPQQLKIVLRNDLGVALTSGAVNTAEISYISA